jgi:hypothetical protein
MDPLSEGVKYCKHLFMNDVMLNNVIDLSTYQVNTRKYAFCL